MATQINSPRLPSPEILARLQTGIADARIQVRLRQEEALRPKIPKQDAT